MAYDLIPGINISSSGLNAEKLRMEITANNIANANARDPKDPTRAYRKKQVMFEAALDSQRFDSKRPGAHLAGVNVKEIRDDDKSVHYVLDPHHKYANKETGQVEQSTISPINEMIDMISATRAYEANLNMIRNSKTMAEKTINLGKS